MPEKEFKVELGNGYYIVSESFRDKGIVERFVVRLMFIDPAGELFIVARFDTAHGIAHFDRLSKSGRLVEKVWLNGLDFNKAYDYALNEFRQNMNTMLSAGKNLERGKPPETSFTVGMTDEEFDRWVEKIGGKPCDEEFWKKMESKGFFRELPPTNSSQAA